MKQFITIFILLNALLISCLNTNAQYDATLKLPSLDFISLNPGDDVVIPVILDNKSTGSLISFLDFYISFNHSLLSWKGTNGNPTLGV
jgi:hypothetical protein